ncbi:hypothetical protein MASR2M66_29630 [Chloroflexota bacterium]
MIWWLVAGVIGVIGIAHKVLSDLRSTASKERQRWENEHQVVEKQVEKYDQQIQVQIQKAQEIVDFHVLANLHFESMKIADHAYELLKDSRVALDAIGNAIVAAGKAKRVLIFEKRISYSIFRKMELEQEISALVNLSDHLFPDKNRLKAQRDHFYTQVQEFNAKTHSLKLAIRDRCGEQGKDWYNRLEARTSVNQENRKRIAAGLPPLAMPESTKAPRKPKPAALPKPKVRGTVKWFDSKKGFGYITPDDRQPDVHVNQKNLSGISSLNQNDRVEFERMTGDRGPWARNVKRI